jgi:hypothetical protein
MPSIQNGGSSYYAEDVEMDNQDEPEKDQEKDLLPLVK